MSTFHQLSGGKRGSGGGSAPPRVTWAAAACGATRATAKARTASSRKADRLDPRRPRALVVISAWILALLLRRLEVGRRGGHAVAEAGRPRAVGEDVPEVGVAAAAEDLGPLHEEAPVVLGLDGLGCDRLGEARPAGAGLELGLRREERLAAADARVGARL